MLERMFLSRIVFFLTLIFFLNLFDALISLCML